MAILPEAFIKTICQDVEEWQPVTGFETRFWISNLGRLISHDHRKNTIALQKPYIDDGGYYQATLRMKPKKRKERVHVLVAEHFLPPHNLSGWIMVNHKDGDKLNNKSSNLEWTTGKGNCEHAVAMGLHDLKGIKHPNAKLMDRHIRKMRILFGQGYTSKYIGSLFKINDRHVRDIVAGRSWKHII